jgi:ABC-2 type transport system permease protein
MGFPIAAIIAGQDAIIGERQSGTAAWVLSKPVSRPAFILSKMAASTIGILVTGVVFQGVIAYIQLSLRIGSPWPVAGFWGAMGMAFLNYMFYLLLSYMLGSIFTYRGYVLGISLALALIGPTMLRSLPFFKDFTPWAFFMPISDEVPTGIALAFGQPLASATPIICTALMCLVFIVVAILHFEREEL